MTDTDIFFLERMAQRLRFDIGAEHEPFVSSELTGAVVAVADVRLPHSQAFLSPDMDLIGILMLLRTANGLQAVLFRDKIIVEIGSPLHLDRLGAMTYEVLDFPPEPGER